MSDYLQMSVEDALEKLMTLAKADPALKEKHLETLASDNPLADFCEIATNAGCPIYEMDLISRGEDRYAAMRRSTNGGGENSPLLNCEDDDYELFMEELRRG